MRGGLECVHAQALRTAYAARTCQKHKIRLDQPSWRSMPKVKSTTNDRIITHPLAIALTQRELVHFCLTCNNSHLGSFYVATHVPHRR